MKHESPGVANLRGPRSGLRCNAVPIAHAHLHLKGSTRMSSMQAPTQGPTGSPVVECSVDGKSNDQMVHWLYPREPDREVAVYDDDGDFAEWQTLSDEEYARQIESWKELCRQWERTGGMWMIAGVPTYTCRVECEDGCRGEGVWTGTTWKWLSNSLATGGKVL